ncbi:MAG TPA: UDP-N-acetylmuramoyl-L-alanyl-D-glutamate--2,6-diaminopimelate ligase [Thermoleophilaceae bacterium]|nr:UDP-N-acetylmuramoyl-L-alanyl-D-glutamate--2,6-diaminopimelate ligase [Thermoleophilaceae bacterium]
MTLRELMGGDAPDVEITGLHYRSSDVRPGGLFFCVPGFTADGHDFAPDAVERGAAAVVCERPLGLPAAEVVVPSVRAAMGPAAARFHGDPTASLRVVGITGTNGKTTTAFLTRAILERGGLQTGLLGTVKSIVGGADEPVERTTPEAIDLQATFRRMLDTGDEACVMEVSSHALELGRAEGIEFACRVFTNLTQDHLDFHPDMEAYFMAKRRLFHGQPGPAVLNLDDDYGNRLADDVAEPVTYAIDSPADYRAREVGFDPSGSSFTCETPDGTVAIETRLPGLFNVQNALAALAAARALGIDLEAARTALAEADRVPGRFEPVDEGQRFTVLVDYAHTPEALENVLRAARELTEGRVHVVFGAGGDRDRAKRPLMGRAAAALADRVVVTSDNPRSEDPEAIIAEILAGTGPGVEREPDRRRAIALVVGDADPGDVVVVAGKGHEQGQEFENGRKEPFDDVTVVREALR